MPSATVTSKGQITIPIEVRTHLGLHPGSRLAFIQTESGTFEIRPETRSVRDLKGLLAQPSVPISVDEMNEAIAKAASEPHPR